MDNSEVVEKSFRFRIVPDCVGIMMKNLMDSSCFSDVTLVCDDYTKIKTHKLVLTSSSFLFKEILKDDKAISEIFLIGIKGSELESILKFIYLGEVDVQQKDLCKFISAAKNLEFNEIVKAVKLKEARKALVEAIQNEVSQNKTEKITEVYLKEEDEMITEIVDQKDVPQHSKVHLKEEEELITEKQSKEGKFKCGECYAKLSSAKGLQKHKKYVHSDKYKLHPCDQCDYKAKQSSNLKVHKKALHGGEKFGCDECDTELTTEYSLKKHKKYVHSGEKYPCNQCDYEGKQPINLKKHKQIVHEGFKPYQCKECDYKASGKHTLKVHNIVKHGDGIMQYCSICNFGTATKARIRRHIESVHEKLRNQCELCDYKVAKSSHLTDHIRSVHEGIRYPCDQCDDYVGKSKRLLREHVKSRHSVICI